MMCPTITKREIQKVLYRLQYIYEKGDVGVLDSYTDLFVAAITHNRSKPIIDNGDYKLYPTTLTLEKPGYTHKFTPQEFSMLYMFESFRGKPMHKDSLVNCARDNSPISDRSLWVIICRLNKFLEGTNSAIIHVAQATYMLGKREDLEPHKVLDRIISVKGEDITIRDALEKYNRDYRHFYGRIRNGWEPEEAMITPRMRRFERRAA